MVAKKNEKFLPAVAIATIAGAHPFAKDGADGRKGTVAEQVSVAIVVGLETIEVADGERPAASVQRRRRSKLLQVLVELAPVAEARQRVDVGGLAEPLTLASKTDVPFRNEPFVMDDTGSGRQPDFELVQIDRFDEVVVRSDSHPAEDFFACASRGSENEVCVVAIVVEPHRLAELVSTHHGHGPIADDHVGGFAVVNLPSLQPIFRRLACVSETANGVCERVSGRVVVFDEEDPHG